MNLAHSQFLALLIFVRENAPFLVPLINLWSIISLAQNNNTGWLIAIILDFYYISYFFRVYKKNPSKETMAMFTSSTVFLIAHLYALAQWGWGSK